MSRTLTLAEQLISCPSVVPDTPDGAACLPLLAAHLKTLGFVCDTIDSIPATLRSLGDLGTLRAGNLWAKWTAAQQHQALAAIKTIVFSGHTKLLPTGPLAQWRSPPFTPTQRNGKLYGRGASGMKTSIAAFVVAVEEFLATTPEPLLNIAVLLTGDDEHALADSTKVKPMIEQLKARGERLDYCIVGEPTAVKRTGDMMISVGVGTDKGRIPRGNPDTGAKGNTPHWHLLELGTQDMRAQPFLRPAAEQMAEQAISTFGSELDKAITKIVGGLK